MNDRTPTTLLAGIMEILTGVGVLVVIFRNLPTTVNLPNTLAWALACALVSGSMWAGLVRIAPSLPVLSRSTGLFGGNAKEPTGKESLLWTPIVFGPVTLAAAYLSPTAGDGATIPLVGYLIGTWLGAAAFYGGHIRDRFLKRAYGYTTQEVLIVWTWSAMLALPSFGGYEVALAAHHGAGAIDAGRAVTRVVLFVLGVSLPVSGFVTLIPDEKQEDTRGMFAGGFLVWSALGCLLVHSPATLWHTVRSLLGIP